MSSTDDLEQDAYNFMEEDLRKLQPHKLLIAVDEDLVREDIENMKFLCASLIGKARLQKVSYGLDLFLLLEYNHKISPKNNDFDVLVEVLYRIHRLDLIRKLGQDPKAIKQKFKQDPTATKLNPFRNLLFKIAEEIPDEEFRTMIFLLGSDISKTSLSRLSSPLELFDFLIKEEEISASDLDLLKKILKDAKRPDLLKLVEHYEGRNGQVENVHSPQDDTNSMPYFSGAVGDPFAGVSIGIQGMKFDLDHCPQSIQETCLYSGEEQLRQLSQYLANECQNWRALFPNMGLTNEEFTNLMKDVDGDTTEQIYRLLRHFRELNVEEFDQKLYLLLQESCFGIHADYFVDQRWIKAIKIPDEKNFTNQVQTSSGVGVGVISTCPQVGPQLTEQPTDVPSLVQREITVENIPLTAVGSLLPAVGEYRMNRKPRGYAIIINNANFSHIPDDPYSKKLDPRKGSEIDMNRLKNTFEKLDYNVEIYEDLTDTQLARLHAKLATYDHQNFDSFVCCILSHGVLGHVYGSNGKLVRIDVLTSFFRAQNCPTLADKPKCFFIQACQGREKQGGLDIQMDTDHLETDQDPHREMIPDEADFILGYATVPGYVSYRSRSQGSWYITKLCENLDNLSKSEDLLSIMLKVNEDVGKYLAALDNGRYKQIPAPWFTLRKKIFFR